MIHGAEEVAISDTAEVSGNHFRYIARLVGKGGRTERCGSGKAPTETRFRSDRNAAVRRDAGKWLENTSLSTGVPLGFRYAAFSLPPLLNRIRYVFLQNGKFPIL